jgi:hypothetical protein
MVRLAQTVHLSCTDTNTVSKRTETRFQMTHITYEFHQVRPKWHLILWYVQCKPCTYLVSGLVICPNGPNRDFIWASSPRTTIRCAKNDFWALVCLMQTEHLSCTDTNTVSKQIETRFHLTHITEEFHRVHLKRFPNLWYVWCKSCTYLALKLTLSPNGPNRASTWASSPRWK